MIWTAWIVELDPFGHRYSKTLPIFKFMWNVKKWFFLSIFSQNSQFKVYDETYKCEKVMKNIHMKPYETD